MSRIFKYIIFIFLIANTIDFNYFALAQDNLVDAIVVRPEIEYKSSQLRDPFQTYIIKEKKSEIQVQGTSNLAQSGINLNDLKVQGIIWGGKMSQAIINNKVYLVGDSINGAEILSIDKQGIKLSSAAGIFDLVAPGQISSPGQNPVLGADINNNLLGTSTISAYAKNPVLDNINKEEPNEKNISY